MSSGAQKAATNRVANNFKNYFFSTHFWGPLANWGIPIAGLVDMQKDASLISPRMTLALSMYSALFMRFAWMVQPRNYLLFSCHLTNETVQLIQGYRYLKNEGKI